MEAADTTEKHDSVAEAPTTENNGGAPASVSAQPASSQNEAMEDVPSEHAPSGLAAVGLPPDMSKPDDAGLGNSSATQKDAEPPCLEPKSTGSTDASVAKPPDSALASGQEVQEGMPATAAEETHVEPTASHDMQEEVAKKSHAVVADAGSSQCMLKPAGMEHQGVIREELCLDSKSAVSGVAALSNQGHGPGATESSASMIDRTSERLTTMDGEGTVGFSPSSEKERFPAFTAQMLPCGSIDISSVLGTPMTFDNNVVSSIDGEPVLIVENIGRSHDNVPKTDWNIPGVSGSSEALDRRNKAQVDGNSSILHAEGVDLVGQKIRKKFGRRYFVGNVVRFDPELKWYKVAYEDGDEEELDIAEVKRTLIIGDADEERHSDRKSSRSSGGISTGLRRRRSRTIEKEIDQSDDEEDQGRSQERLKTRVLHRHMATDSGMKVTENSESNDEDRSPRSQDDSGAESHFGSRRKVRRRRHRLEDFSRAHKRRKFELDEESAGSESRFWRRKSEDTPAEHRVATRSSTGSLVGPSDSSRSKKGHDDFETPYASPPVGGGDQLIGRRTRKDFGGQLYIGEVIGYDLRAKYYKVRYEDGDEEELEWDELEPTLLAEEEHQQVLALEAPYQAVKKFSDQHLKENSRRISTSRSKHGALILYEGGENNGDLPNSARRWRRKIRTASVSVMMKGTEEWAATSASHSTSEPPPRPLATARYASANDAEIFEYFGWGELVNFERSKCPEVRATRLLPTSSPVVHLAASRHHLAALTAAGQVWIWRCKHGNIHTRCNEWEHVSSLDNKNVILIDISGPDVDRACAGYQAGQEDQVPDPFYLVAVSNTGEDIILQGSQPHEPVHTCQYVDERQHPGLKVALLQSNPNLLEGVGRIVQVSVGMVEAADESPFVGYITDTDRVYIRSATRDYMEETNLVTGYTGKPVKIQCGRVYHAIIMTDDGRAWTWGEGYYPGSNSISSGFAGKWTSPFSICQPAVGTLVGRKVVDVGCYGEDFIALTNDGEVHQWTHAVPNPAAGVYNVPATPIYGHGPSIGNGDKLKQVSIGAGVCAGITECGKVHTWRTSMKGGFVGVVGSEGEALTPLAREEGYKETVILTLGSRVATKIVCVAGSLLIVVRRRMRGRRGGRRKFNAALKGNLAENKATTG